jgi:hypothetical protein
MLLEKVMHMCTSRSTHIYIYKHTITAHTAWGKNIIVGTFLFGTIFWLSFFSLQKNG